MHSRISSKWTRPRFSFPEIRAALACMEGETFKEFDLVESDTNHDHEDIVENIEVYRCAAIKRLE